MAYINEYDLELFLLNSSEQSEKERDFILKHLSECSACADNFNKIKEFYAFIETNIHAEEKEDETLANKILGSNTLPYENKTLNEHNRAVKVYDGKYEIIESKKDSLVSRSIELIRIYPYRFSGSLAFVGLLIALFLFTKKPETKYINPTLAVIKDNVLTVYNEMGDLMWKKGVPGMVDFRTDLPVDSQILQFGSRELLLDDLDGNGINELLIAGKHPGLGSFASDTLYCFDPSGKLVWKYGCGSFRSFNTPRWKHNNWFINDYFTVNTATGKKMFVVASTNFGPTKIFELDFITGNIKQEFYNSGGISATKLFDIDDDGYEEIILGGINNAFSCAFVAVFKPDSVFGFSYSTEVFIPKELQKNSALKYILFPTTNYLQAVSRTDYNKVEQFFVSKEEKTITAYIQEAPGGLPNIFGAVLYNFDLQWNVRGIVLADNFIANYNRLFDQGKVKEPLDSNYTKKLAEGVRYLK